jgi:predicted nucleic acid-binding protein
VAVHVFIDTNIFLSFFAYTNDDIEELKKLVGLIKNDKIDLYLTDHACREFGRNRESKILQALGEFGKFSLPGLPRLMTHYAEGKAFARAAKDIKKIHGDLVARVKADALAEVFPADELFAAIMNAEKPIIETEKDLLRAQRRTERSDPPGKSGSLGDRLNWELLLSNAPDGTDMHVISKDGDFASSIDATKPHPVLLKEWKRENGGVLHLHNGLGAFISAHFPDIKLAADIEKRDAINSLVNSGSFSTTHRAIEKLEPFVELLAAPEIDELVDGALKNQQVSWIGTDADVQAFFAKIARSRWESYPTERRERLVDIFGLTKEGEIADEN